MVEARLVNGTSVQRDGTRRQERLDADVGPSAQIGVVEERLVNGTSMQRDGKSGSMRRAECADRSGRRAPGDRVGKSGSMRTSGRVSSPMQLVRLRARTSGRVSSPMQLVLEDEEQVKDANTTQYADLS